MSLACAGAMDSPVSDDASIPILYSTPHAFATSPSSVPSMRTSAMTTYFLPVGPRSTTFQSSSPSGETLDMTVSRLRSRNSPHEAAILLRISCPTWGSKLILLTQPVLSASQPPYLAANESANSPNMPLCRR